MSAPRLHRILYISHTGRVSGAEKVLLSMLKGLDRTRYEAFALCPAEGELRTMIQAQGVTCASTPPLEARFTWRVDKLVRYLASFLDVMRPTRRQIALINPDFVHANTLRAGIVGTMATFGTGRKIVWHVHDSLPRHPLSSVIRLLAYMSTRTQVIAVSEAAASRFRGSLPFQDRLRVIHNGTDLVRFPLKQQGVSPLKEELGLSKTDFLACAVGQVCPRKGLRELIEAFASIRADVPYLHIAIVGKPVFAHDEAYCDQLIAMTAAYGIADRVHFSGQRSDISASLQSADLLVLNSLEEPFGLVLVEAMSSGTPVLAARVGGIPEIVTDSESGWLVTRGDTNALARKLFQLSTDRDSLESVAQFAREVVCPRFTLEAFLAKLHVFYGRLLSQHHSEQRVHVPGLINALQDDKGDQHV